MTPTAHISVAKDMGSKLTTSGATNSGVPVKIRISQKLSKMFLKYKLDLPNKTWSFL